MKVIRIKKQGYVILLIIFVFVFANIILLYKFTSGRSRDTVKGIQEKERQNWKGIRNHGTEHQINSHNLEGGSYKVLPRKKPKPGKTVQGSERIQPQVIEKKSHTRRILLTPESKIKDPSGLLLGDKNNLSTKLKDFSSKINFENSKESLKQKKSFVTAVVVIACNRPTVKRCVDQLLKYRPSAERFPVIVSQDCGDEETAHVIQTFGNKVVHIRQPDLGSVDGIPANMRRFHGYYKISRHYKWALGQIFDHMGYDRAIVVEDDLDVAPDFFEYFEGTTSILEQDPTLWCVSAWNDNGKEGMVKGNDILYRTDFFPGLGWMLTKSLWEELKPKWPLGFWDDWMREPSQRKSRACIRPEISRTRTFGRIGVSQGQFFDQYLKFIKLNDKPFPFTKTDLTYLLKLNYDHHFLDRVHSLPVVTVGHILGSKMAIKEVQVHYSTDSDFASVARSVGAMADFKAGIPRMAYKGVVTVMYKGTRVYLTPK